MKLIRRILMLLALGAVLLSQVKVHTRGGGGFGGGFAAGAFTGAALTGIAASSARRDNGAYRDLREENYYLRNQNMDMQRQMQDMQRQIDELRSNR